MKTEIFNKLVDITSEVTEIPREKILSRSRDEELVDARTIVAVMLGAEGFYIKQIANIFGYSRARVGQVMTEVPYKAKNNKMFKRNLDEVAKRYESLK